MRELFQTVDKFDHPITLYLWNRVLDGTLVEEEWDTDQEVSGDWITRAGKRVIWGDISGRVWSYRHLSVQEAQQDLDDWLKDHPHLSPLPDSDEDF